MAIRLTFYGGAGKVTGSNFLVEHEGSRVLVDCGIEQGKDFCESCVYGPFPYDPHGLHALVVTHAHLDHIGRIPKLVKEGFGGAIYLTPPTRDLMELILRDSVGILAEEAKRRGREPLYALADVERALSLTKTLSYHEETTIAPGLSLYFRNTGHILGSASARIRDASGTTLVITGDIGNSPSPLLPDFETVSDADALIMESVYGDRLHPNQKDRFLRLKKTIADGIARGGAVLIPAFSMERTQLMLYELSNMFSEGMLPRVPVFLDSPLAIHVTDIYEKWGPTYFKDASKHEMKREGSLFTFPFLMHTLANEDSERIASVRNPKIIIAGAGMSHGGRIGRWEKRYLPDPKTTLLIVGYQAPGSPGRLLAEGVSPVSIGGEQVSVRARVEVLEGWSAHADRDGLLAFAATALPKAKVIFAALGEPKTSSFFAQRIHDYLGGRAVVPEVGQTWEITTGSAQKLR